MTIVKKTERNIIMDFLELAEKRFSCRKFKDMPIEEEKIQAMLKSAQLAPTAVNFQPQRILVLTDKEKIEKLDTNKCTRYTFNAPLIMVVCYDTEKSWKRRCDNHDEGEVDASIVTAHIMFEAVQLGLGCTWVGSFNPDIAREVLNIPDNYNITALLPIGYPDEEPSENHRKRIAIEEFAFRNEFK